MAFEQLPVDKDHISEWMDTSSAAFMANPNSLSHVFYKNGITPEIKQWQYGQHLQSVEEDPDDFEFIIRDATTGEAVGVSRWHFNTKSRTDEEVLADEQNAAQKRKERLESLEGFNYDAFGDFRDSQNEAKRKYLGGKAYIYLHILGTHPDHRRKGVATYGLQWGISKAKELGLPIYLESSEEGSPVYKRAGFEELGRLNFDARRWGHPTEGKFLTMLWTPPNMAAK